MFTAAYSRLSGSAPTLTVRGFPGRVYRTVAGAKSAARYAEGRDERAAAAAKIEAARLAFWARPRKGTKSSILPAAMVAGIRATPSAPPIVWGTVPTADEIDALFGAA